MLQTEKVRDKYERKHIVSIERSSFEDWLKQRIERGEGTATVEITPDQAAHIFTTYNDHNRPFRIRYAQEVAHQMKEGKWTFTGMPIVFSDLGRMIDGQHRVWGCAESGVSMKALLVFGVPDEAFDKIDIGKKRTAGDIFARHGVPDSKLVAAATSAVHSLAHNPRRLGLVARDADGKNLTSADLFAFFDSRHRGLLESRAAGDAIRRARLGSGALFTALHYICAKRSREDANTFFRQVADGVGLTSKKAPAWKLRDMLQNNALADAKMSQRRMAALTIRAWNAYRLRKTLGTLKFGDNETFPKVM